jgi:hypothetical protein
MALKEAERSPTDHSLSPTTICHRRHGMTKLPATPLASLDEMK